jgi:uncharacterized metal-binding protein
MNQQRATKDRIFMLPCSGVSEVGRLTVRAVQDLVLEGRGEWLTVGRLAEISATKCTGTASLPCIVVDGCGQQCIRKRLEADNYTLEFHLSLDDLGIANTDATESMPANLQLAKDAIIAGSSRLSERQPALPGGCGCR